MTTYFTRLVKFSSEARSFLYLTIPSLTETGGDSAVFEHESSNEAEVGRWFREIVLSCSTGGAVWLTPVSLEKDQPWLTGLSLELFLLNRQKGEG